MTAPAIERSATISDDGVYRYMLTRRWSDAAPDAWMMLNPSTADGTEDDPTIRRCMGFSRGWGAGGIIVVNLFALRATNPKALARHADPVGPENDDAILDAAAAALALGGRIIAAWGANAMARERGRIVANLVAGYVGAQRLLVMGTTGEGAPKHPLYLKGDLYPRPWRAR